MNLSKPTQWRLINIRGRYWDGWSSEASSRELHEFDALHWHLMDLGPDAVQKVLPEGGTCPLPICGSLQGTPLWKFSAREPVVNQCPSGIPSYRLTKGDIEHHHYHKTYYCAHGS